MKPARQVISESPRKNTREVVYHNIDLHGKRFSVTLHERIDPNKPVYQRVFPKPPK